MNGSIQALIDRTAAGGELKLEPPRCEIQGPIVFRQPITVIGRGCSVWAEKGPVLTVQSSGVVLRDLNVEVTGTQADLGEAESCALIVEPRLGISLQNVVVRGNVRGLSTEDGNWRYPRAIRLGVLQANQRHTFTLRLAVPVACRASSE